MNEYQAKTTNAKIQRAKKLKELEKKNDKLSAKQHRELLDSIASLQANISSLEASLSANGTSYTQSQKDLVQNFSTLQEILQSGLNVNNLKDIKQAKEIIVSNLKDIPKPVINTHKTEIPEWLASDKSVQILNDNVIKVVQALIDLEANIKPSQNADEFVPFRRVIRQGNQLVFDDSDWASRSGGGGSGGGTTGGLTDAELRATPVPVSGTVTEANSAAIKTAVETIDNAISGSEMQVDVVGALPAGTNAIGKLAANSGVDIGDVDVTSAVSSSFATGSNLDIDTSAEQLVSSSVACKFGVTVKAAATNTGTVYIGSSSSVTAGTTGSTDGFPLEPGESVTVPVNNVNLLYGIASVANQKVFLMGV